MGDDTAKRDGRLSFNPINHIDPIGLISMIVLRFGWAKAVPINPYKFKNRKKGTLIVSLAGVFVNFILAIIFALLTIFFLYMEYNTLGEVTMLCLWYNAMLGVFNLLPLPPLDGSKVLATLLPSELEYKFYRYERYLYIILVVLLLSGMVSRFIGPIVQGLINNLLRIGAIILNAVL